MLVVIFLCLLGFLREIEVVEQEPNLVGSESLGFNHVLVLLVEEAITSYNLIQ